MIILGIETSCDETSAAVLRGELVLSNIISSQLIHRHYGGVVPELASRAHQRLIIPVIDEALASAGVSKGNLNAVAVTYGPGLVGALLVGVQFAKSLAFALDIPLIGVNHMEAHIYSNFLGETKPAYPFLCLTVSGGHTQLVLIRKPLDHHLLGETLDDAAGEAYDKVAKMLGLGFPGGPVIDGLAQEGNPAAIAFPRPYLNDSSDDFSFSGIKTAVLYWLRNHGYSGRTTVIDGKLLADICASFQAAVVDVLVGKTIRAARRHRVSHIAVAGGVSANMELRKRMVEAGRKSSLTVSIPPLEFCTDNGAMIAMAGLMKLSHDLRSDFELDAVPNLAVR